jgi:hypothetical protein
MRRLKASAALVLTAFFAAAGAFHHHPLPRTTHDHAGFCSAATAGIALESCALCKVAHTSVDLAAQGIAPYTLDTPSRLAVTAICSPANAGSSLLYDSRAPPAV